MIYCFDDQGQPVAEDMAMKVIKTAANRAFRLFPSESFDLDDIVQEVLVRLIKETPLENIQILYVAAYRRAVDFHRLVAGRNEKQWKERGGRRMLHREDLNFRPDTEAGRQQQFEIACSKERPPDYEPELRDLIDWAMSKLSERDKKIVLAYADDDFNKGSIAAVAAELGVSSVAITQRHAIIMETMNNARQRRIEIADDGTDCQEVISRPTHSVEADRQRKIKRLANTR